MPDEHSESEPRQTGKPRGGLSGGSEMSTATSRRLIGRGTGSGANPAPDTPGNRLTSRVLWGRLNGAAVLESRKTCR